MAEPKRRTIDRIRTNFFASRQRMEILEWCDEEGHPLELFFTPLTGRDVEQLNARETKTDAEYLAAIIILKAFDEHNAPHFSWGDMQALLSEAHYPVIFRVAQAIQTRFALPIESVEIGKKNLGMTEPLPSNSTLPNSSDALSAKSTT